MEDFSLLKIKVCEELKPVAHIAQYKVQLIDLDGDGAGTSEDGYTIRDVRRRNKAKITVKLENLNFTEFTNFMSYIDFETFELTYFAGTFKTITAHCGDRDIELVKALRETENLWNISLSFIEREEQNIPKEAKGQRKLNVQCFSSRKKGSKASLEAQESKRRKYENPV